MADGGREGGLHACGGGKKDDELNYKPNYMRWLKSADYQLLGRNETESTGSGGRVSMLTQGHGHPPPKRRVSLGLISRSRRQRRRTIQIQQRMPPALHLVAPGDPRVDILVLLAVVIDLFLRPVAVAILRPRRPRHDPEVLLRVLVQVDGFEDGGVGADGDEQGHHVEVARAVGEAGLEVRVHLRHEV